MKNVVAATIFMSIAFGANAQSSKISTVGAKTALKSSNSTVKRKIGGSGPQSLSTDWCMQESEMGCPAPLEITIWSTSFTDQNLGRVIVEGRRTVGVDNFGWVTACRGTECYDIDDNVWGKDGKPETNIIQDAVIFHTGVNRKKDDACESSKSVGTSEATQYIILSATSLSTNEQRLDAARTGMQNSGLLTKLSVEMTSLYTATGYRWNEGFKITYTHIDGGTEEFMYVLQNPTEQRVVPVAGSLVKGNGISKCPKQ